MIQIHKINIILLILILFIPSICASEWELDINSRIEYNSYTATGQFIAGADNSALDGLDSYDVRMVEAPSYSIPFYSILNNEYFMVDYKSSLQLNQPKTWQINQRGSSEFRRAGTLDETITWDLSNVPNEIELTLIDYGNDGTRTTIVQEINLRAQSSYTFQVTRPYQEYRYFDFIATLTQEICYESWSCTSWQPSTCPQSEVQTRTCTDNNNCGTTNNKPAETQQCAYVCQEDWSCTSWSSCSPSGTQTRTCTDNNNCGTTNNKPIETQTCGYICTESWSCTSWQPSTCPSSRIQTRSCTDANNCGTTADKPSETQSCIYSTTHNNNDEDDKGDGNKCSPSWSCTVWTPCSAIGFQARVCDDENDCGTENGKPAESISCVYTPTKTTEQVELVRLETQPQQTIPKLTGTEAITGAIVITPKKADPFIGLLVSTTIALVGIIIFIFIIRSKI